MANEKRLIDANALLKRLRISYLYHKAKPYIDNAPTVDAVEVVWCKDCKRYSQSGLCNLYLNVSHQMKPDDFCSYGERREGE